MRGATVLPGLALVIGAFACVVKLQGAPCDNDKNCPLAQYCAADGGTGACIDGPMPIDVACDRIVSAVAARLTSCYGGDPRAWRLIAGADMVCGAVVSSVHANRQAYAPALLPTCTDAIASRPCEQLLSVRDLLAGCTALTPKVETAQLCGISFDCDGGFCDTSASCPGQCRPFIKAGAPCDSAGLGCEEGTSCFGTTCQPYGAAAAACNLFTPQCQPSLGCISGKCANKELDGGNCTLLGTECAGRYSCVGAGFGVPGTCQPAKDVGAPCTPGRGECGPLLWCGGTPATCQPWAQHHQACGLIGSELVGCLDGRCVSGRCEDFLASGEQCTGTGDCGPTGRCAKVGTSTSVCQPNSCTVPP